MRQERHVRYQQAVAPIPFEVSSELPDILSTSYAALYPNLKEYVTIAIHDVTNQVLSGVDTKF